MCLSAEIRRPRRRRRQGLLEVSAVCSIVGGMAADQLIKAVTGREKPLRNLFVYDGRDGMGAVYDIPAA